mmetsp:Transcript_22652/g.51043  ORF Transcript_22652/g.51043 Transcript_22652/m.51043 type:complete len:200 (-) Transcript_22652:706-1305(-)
MVTGATFPCECTWKTSLFSVASLLGVSLDLARASDPPRPFHAAFSRRKFVLFDKLRAKSPAHVPRIEFQLMSRDSRPALSCKSSKNVVRTLQEARAASLLAMLSLSTLQSVLSSPLSNLAVASSPILFFETVRSTTFPAATRASRAPAPSLPILFCSRFSTWILPDIAISACTSSQQPLSPMRLSLRTIELRFSSWGRT